MDDGTAKGGTEEARGCAQEDDDDDIGNESTSSPPPRKRRGGEIIDDSRTRTRTRTMTTTTEVEGGVSNDASETETTIGPSSPPPQSEEEEEEKRDREEEEREEKEEEDEVWEEEMNDEKKEGGGGEDLPLRRLIPPTHNPDDWPLHAMLLYDPPPDAVEAVLRAYPEAVLDAATFDGATALRIAAERSSECERSHRSHSSYGVGGVDVAISPSSQRVMRLLLVAELAMARSMGEMEEERLGEGGDDDAIRTEEGDADSPLIRRWEKFLHILYATDTTLKSRRKPPPYDDDDATLEEDGGAITKDAANLKDSAVPAASDVVCRAGSATSTVPDNATTGGPSTSVVPGQSLTMNNNDPAGASSHTATTESTIQTGSMAANAANGIKKPSVTPFHPVHAWLRCLASPNLGLEHCQAYGAWSVLREMKRRIPNEFMVRDSTDGNRTAFQTLAESKAKDCKLCPAEIRDIVECLMDTNHRSAFLPRKSDGRLIGHVAIENGWPCKDLFSSKTSAPCA
ncbi:hypothetical protein ACHAXA_009553 [Cyclostephanos tholiformis]|uniref:Uncharacterized protein n=1 Tax=Cyclostephanos tholiformis TaxID=382380 RepID=A0ABD3SE37_9STRA